MRNRFIGLLCLILTLAVFSSLPAQVSDSIDYSKYTARSDSAAAQRMLTPVEYSYGRAIWVSILFLIVLIIALGLYKKMASKNRQINPSAIRVLSRYHLSSRQAILIVAIEDKKYALGSTENAINTLAELGPLTEEELKQAAVPGISQFGELIKKMVTK